MTKKKNKKKVAEIDPAVRKEWLAKVEEDIFALESAPEEIKSDREIVLAAVQRYGSALEHAIDDLKSDREIVLAAVSNDGSALYQANDVLKSDREIVLAAVKNSWVSLGCADESFKSDPEMLNATITSCELSLTTGEEDPRSWTPPEMLHEALCGDFHPEVISALIEAGADVNDEEEDGDGLTPLMLAARASSYPEVVSLLIDAGGDINFQARYGSMYVPSALMRAIASETRDPFTGRWSDAEPNYEVISAFIRAGADVNATHRNEDVEDQSVLLWALEHQPRNPAIIIALIKAGADVNWTFFSCDSPGDAPVLIACLQDSPHARSNFTDDSLEVISLLIDAGADVNVARDDGVTPLIAALLPSPRALRKGFEWDKIEGNTLEGNDLLPELISMLIKAGADVNYQEVIVESEWVSRVGRGFTVLMYALKSKASPAVFSLLLEAGADVHAKSNEGKTVLEYAAEMDLNPEVEALLASKEK